MYTTPIMKTRDFLSATRGYFETHESGPFHRVKLNDDNELKVRLIGPSHHSCSTFRLLQDYGSGRDGRVWLVATKAGETKSVLNVLKMPKNSTQVSSPSVQNANIVAFTSSSPVFTSSSAAQLTSIPTIEKERRAWVSVLKSLKLNEKLVRIVSVCGSNCLLMPFCFHLLGNSNHCGQSIPVKQQSSVVVAPSTTSSSSSSSSFSSSSVTSISTSSHTDWQFSYPDHRDPSNHKKNHYFSDNDIAMEPLSLLISDANRSIESIAEEAIAAVANAGLHHNDVQWRHIAFFVVVGTDGQLQRRPILIDLTDVSPIGDESKESVIKKMKNQLKRQ
jgi:hypothetical protein